ncbi:MAG: septation protein A [Methylococcales bacterium]|jgi:intracellular septation protein|nr:septation protein A [Methylococcales bacterium]MBT3699495.1 septation protein A [Methylococcales bacterium]MBT4348564.1 septation protein A [Methylococcales bacterium]MBT4600249.1 septation protein A [Methylococcales bacterium]MBT4765741.1 septation protein A [Methylococcales bacterium]
MKLLFDFFPIILFFGAFKLYGIYMATAVAIGATILQVTFTWIRYRKVEMMHWITLILIVVMGGLTLYLQDEQFIKLKPSIINWLFGIAFLGSQFWGKRPFVERMMASNIELPQPVWKRLNLAWSFYFIVLGFVNLYVINNFDTDTWVNFKLFGMLGLTFIFIIIQALYLSKYMPKDEKES